MTGQPAETPPTPEPPPFRVVAKKRTRLEQLHASYADAKAEAAAAEEKLDAIKDAIKLELTQAAPDATKIELHGPEGSAAPPLALTYTETWRFDSRKFKADDPLTYVRYAKKSGSWRLAEARAAGGGQS